MHIAECGKASLAIRLPILDRDHRNIMNAPESFVGIHTTAKTSSRPHISLRASWGPLVVKIPPTIAGDTGDAGLIPESGRSPGEGHNNPLLYSCLRIPWTEEPGRLQSTGLQSWTWLKQPTYKVPVICSLINCPKVTFPSFHTHFFSFSS